jgi:hypothetical protein
MFAQAHEKPEPPNCRQSKVYSEVLREFTLA